MSESPSAASDEVIELPPDEVIRVLQVRPRARFQVTTPEPAVSFSAPAAAPPARAAFVAPPPPKPVSATPSAVPPSRKRERSLEETLDDLQALVTMEPVEDTGATTGVRHLHVELQKPTRPVKKR